jgi:hypothetical protein
MPGAQTKSRPDGRLEESLKIWWRLLELVFRASVARIAKMHGQNSEVVIHKFAP